MLPNHFKEIELGMSNLDHEINPGFEDAIKGKPAFGKHSAWGFNGNVYYLDNQFNEDVWVYQYYQETVSADSLKQLMEKVNARHGQE